MTSVIATVFFAVGILGLFALDRDRNARTSKALWLPVIWMSLAGSRMVSQWLDAGLVAVWKTAASWNAPASESADGGVFRLLRL